MLHGKWTQEAFTSLPSPLLCTVAEAGRTITVYAHPYLQVIMILIMFSCALTLTGGSSPEFEIEFP